LSVCEGEAVRWLLHGFSVHVSLMWKLLFSARCSNRSAASAIRAGADATPANSA
jgi:hypothetical protein